MFPSNQKTQNHEFSKLIRPLGGIPYLIFMEFTGSMRVRRAKFCSNLWNILPKERKPPENHSVNSKAAFLPVGLMNEMKFFMRTHHYLLFIFINTKTLQFNK